MILAPSKVSSRASNAKVVSPLPTVNELDLELSDRELVKDHDELKLEAELGKLHLGLKDMILEVATCKFHFNIKDGTDFRTI